MGQFIQDNTLSIDNYVNTIQLNKKNIANEILWLHVLSERNYIVTCFFFILRNEWQFKEMSDKI
jgi:hypothetical protein